MNRVHHIILPLLTLLALTTSCSKIIYEDLEECPQGVYISFYNQTPCMETPETVGEVNGLYVFAFDLNDVLVTVKKVTGWVDLTEAYKVELPPVEKGQYSFIAWGGTADQYFTFENFVEGTTTKKDVMLRLRAENDKAISLGEHKVWQGESRVISLPDRKEYGTVFGEVAINMLEVTNRINITLRLHESVQDRYNIDDFDILAYSADGTYLINRRMPLDNPTLNYPGVELYKDKAARTLSFTLMELKTGYHNLLRLHNKKEKKDFLEQDLLGKVILENPNVNLECTHDFDIVLELEDKCKDCPDNNLVINIFINNYQIHSFAVNLTNRY